jgi:hypothetical protein
MGFLFACLLFCVVVCTELDSDQIPFDLSETDLGGVVPELSREDLLRALRASGNKRKRR